MTTPSRRLKLARDAIDSVIGVLEALPRSDEQQRLLHEANGCRRVIDEWVHEPPTIAQHETAMQRVLKLHIAAARLARASRGGCR